MQKLKKTDYLKVLKKESAKRTPIWMMRQAGRYLPEYRKVRSNFDDFMSMCKNPEACCEVAMQPLRRFDLDASIIFSDILTIPEAMGIKLKFIENIGPSLEKTIKNEQDIKKLNNAVNSMENLEYIKKTVSTTKHALDHNIPLIGFCGSPWTVATYMIEGGTSKKFIKIRKMMYENPKLLVKLLKKISEISKIYLENQIRSGVDAIIIFDTWGGILSEKNYFSFSFKYMNDICNYIKSKYNDIPITLFTKDSGLWIDKIYDCSCDAIGIDWKISMLEAHKKVKGKYAIQGNIDPAQLYGSNKDIKNSVREIFLKKPISSRYIFNLGHGIHPDTNPEKVQVMIESVREYGQIIDNSH